MINITNEDNMALMARYPDNHFDLAIVDPPYGIGAGSKKFINRNTANKNAEKFYRDNDWDVKPSAEYFKELDRVSKKYIVWGGNYFVDMLKPARCYIVWNKKTGENSYADCELGLTNFDSNAKIYDKFWLGAHANNGTPRIHPTEKPVSLYEFCIMNYAKEGDKILDTHGGSLSIALAVHNVNSKEYMNLTLDVCELDKEYFDTGVKRYKNHTQQKTIFDL